MKKLQKLPFSIEKNIFFIRGEKVMLDLSLARLYGVETKVLLQAIKRNSERFPEDFMFQLTAAEVGNLRSQIVTSSWGGRRFLPYAFTEQGIAMLSGVLRSHKAILINVQIMRAFVQIRKMLNSHRDLKQKIEDLEKKYDKQFKVVFDTIREIILPQETKKRPIGFAPWEGIGTNSKALLRDSKKKKNLQIHV